MGVSKVRRHVPYLVDAGDDVKLIDWDGQAYAAPRAAVRVVSPRRVLHDTLL